MIDELTTEERARIQYVCRQALLRAGYERGTKPDPDWRDACCRRYRELRDKGICPPAPVPNVSLDRLLADPKYHDWYRRLMEGRC